MIRFRLFGRNDKIGFGQKGEDAAAGFLRKRGYKILERNFRTKNGEIDIVAKDKDQLVFVEVKTRSSDNREFLTNSVNRGKARRFAKTAMWYLAGRGSEGFSARFDVVFVIISDSMKKIEHIKDAFRLDEIGRDL